MFANWALSIYRLHCYLHDFSISNSFSQLSFRFLGVIAILCFRCLLKNKTLYKLFIYHKAVLESCIYMLSPYMYIPQNCIYMLSPYIYIPQSCIYMLSPFIRSVVKYYTVVFNNTIYHFDNAHFSKRTLI